MRLYSARTRLAMLIADPVIDENQTPERLALVDEDNVPIDIGGLAGDATGPAGGVLAGTYPNPTFAVDMATQAELDTEITARNDGDVVLFAAVDNASDRLDVLEAAGGGPTLVTALPASPVDGQDIYYVVDGAAGRTWHLRFYTALNKWLYLGGHPLRAAVATNETTSSSSFVDLATTGPSITVPDAGSYEVLFGASLGQQSGGAQSSTRGIVSPSIGGAAATIADSFQRWWETGGEAGTSSQEEMNYKGIFTLPASGLIRLKYRADGITWGFSKRWVEVRPITLDAT